jgi:hypothetical protein
MEATTTTKPYQWENIDSILAEVAEEIEIGQVVGTEKLNLYDSMSALEVCLLVKKTLKHFFIL